MGCGRGFESLIKFSSSACQAKVRPAEWEGGWRAPETQLYHFVYRLRNCVLCFEAQNQDKNLVPGVAFPPGYSF